MVPGEVGSIVSCYKYKVAHVVEYPPMHRVDDPTITRPAEAFCKKKLAGPKQLKPRMNMRICAGCRRARGAQKYLEGVL